MGAGIDGGTDPMRCAAMASVSHQGMSFPLRGTDRAEDIGPFGALVAGRPRARATSGPSACELILLADAGFRPQLYLDAFREPRPDLRQFGGEAFFKSLDGQLVLRIVARPRRDLGEAERSTRARPWSRRARWRTSPSHSPGPCAASARRRSLTAGTGPASTWRRLLDLSALFMRLQFSLQCSFGQLLDYGVRIFLAS